MAIVAGDLKYYLSGGSGNTDPNASLGGAISTTEVSGTSLNNIFDNVSGSESEAGDTEYRCIYLKNTHGSLTLQTARTYFSDVTTDENANIAIAMGLGSSGDNGTEQTIANENTAPTSVTFSTPTDYAGGLSLGNLVNGHFYPVWLRRITTAGAVATNGVDATIAFKGETAA